MRVKIKAHSIFPIIWENLVLLNGAFQTNYTRVYDQNIGFSNTTVEFAKPAVYHAVTKINKYVIKSVKKGKMTKEKASKLLCYILDCANTIIYEPDTKALEEELSSTKETSLLINIFKQIKLVKA